MFLHPSHKSRPGMGNWLQGLVDNSYRTIRKLGMATGGLALAMLLTISTQAADAKSAEQRYARITGKATKALLLDVTRAATGNRIVTVGDRGHILYSDDNGLTWEQARVPTIQMLTAVTFPSREVGYAVGHDALVLKTVDGGENWVEVYADPELQAPLLDAWFGNDQYGFVIGAYGTILRTQDGGKTWEDRRDAIDNEDEYHYNAITRATDDTLFIAGEAGMLFRSPDQGESWQNLDSPYEGSWFGIFANDNDVFVHGLRGTIYKSADLGDSWRPMDSGTEQTLFGSTSLDNGKTIFVGNSGSFLSGPAGNWSTVNRKDRLSLNALTFSSDGSIIVVGQGGVHRMSVQGEELDVKANTLEP